MTNFLWNKRTSIYAGAKNPCQGCKDRTVEPNCHMNCEKLNEYYELVNRIKAEKKKAEMFYNYEGEFAAKYRYDTITKRKK